MEDEIHFLINEIEGELQNKVQNILKGLDQPYQKKDNLVVKKFTRALVQATAQRLYPQQPRQQQREQPNEFAQLKELERRPLLPPLQRVAPQPIYYTPVMRVPPQREIPVQRQHEQSPTIPPTTQEPQRDGFMPSGLPPRTAEQQPLSKLPTDETMAFMPDSLTQYKLPLSAETQKAQNNPQFTPAPTLQPQAPPMIVPAPTLAVVQPIALAVPQGTEPPIALIVDAESKKPIVTVAIQNDVYTVIEPSLAPEEINMVTWLRKKFFGKEKNITKKKKLNKKIWKAAKKMHFNMQKNDDNEYLKMKYYLVKHLLQFGWIEPLLHDEEVMKINCEGENIPLTIVRNNKLLKTNITYPSADHINRFLIRFAARAYKKVSEKNPIMEFTANKYHIEGSLKTATTPARFTLIKVL